MHFTVGGGGGVAGGGARGRELPAAAWAAGRAVVRGPGGAVLSRQDAGEWGDGDLDEIDADDVSPLVDAARGRHGHASTLERSFFMCVLALSAVVAIGQAAAIGARVAAEGPLWLVCEVCGWVLGEVDLMQYCPILMCVRGGRRACMGVTRAPRAPLRSCRMPRRRARRTRGCMYTTSRSLRT